MTFLSISESESGIGVTNTQNQNTGKVFVLKLVVIGRNVIMYGVILISKWLVLWNFALTETVNLRTVW